MSELIKSFESRYEEYLEDESKMKGEASSISFPETIDDVVKIVKQMEFSKSPITVQGSKTGICGGAVPLGGHILNLSNLNKVLDFFKTDKGCFIKVQAGVLLSELQKEICKKSNKLNVNKVYFWPPEPTETSATIGGILATNAQGICGGFYGDTKQYVEEISLINAHGEEMIISRGKYKICNNKCILPNGEILIVNTDVLKLSKEIDLVDLYLGSEGMYGIIVTATLRLIERPKEIWGIGFFFESQDNLFKFTEELRSSSYKEDSADIAAIEYLDNTTLDNIHEFKKVATKLNELPDVDEKYIGMLYVELHGEDEEDIEVIAEKLMELAMKYGSDDDATWALSGNEEIDKMRIFRHAAPESINILIEKVKQSDNRIMKLSTDISFTEKEFGEVVEMYQKDAMDEGVRIAIFGHVEDNRVHVNILPNNYEEYLIGKKLIKKWSNIAVKKGNRVFSEHGVGKIKKELFNSVMNKGYLRNIQNIKEQLDPDNILNFGNLFN